MVSTILGIILGVILAGICGLAFMLASTFLFNIDGLITDLLDSLIGFGSKRKDTKRDWVVVFFCLSGIAIGGYCGWTLSAAIF